MSNTEHPKPHPSKKAALEQLAKEPLSCVTWLEGGVLMSAIYWNGRRRIQKADQKFDWTKT